MVAHPALVVESSGLAVRLLDYPGEARLAHEDGVVALAMKQASQVVKSLRKGLFSGNELVLAFAALELDRKRLADDTIAAVAHNALVGLEPPRAEAAFKDWFDGLRGRWYPEAMALGEALAEALKAWTTARTL